MKAEKKRSIRNLIIFSIAVLAIGWVGVWVDSGIEKVPGEETPGMGIWLIVPLIMVILLRSLGGDGWKDAGLLPRFSKNLKWYGVAFIIFPLVTGFSLLLGYLGSWIYFSAFNPEIYFRLFGQLLIINIVKNIFEESVWRGYLAARLIHIKVNDLSLYLISGLIWGLWHAPYYLVFLPEDTIRAVLPVSRLAFTLIALVNITAWTVMFVELFRLSRSIWPVILLHAVEDALVNHLIIDGHIAFAQGAALWLSPISGIIPSLLYLVIGLWLRNKRIALESQHHLSASLHGE